VRTYQLLIAAIVIAATLTAHKELKNPENYNTQEPMADEAVRKDQLGL
jgi:hypothetical protein